MNLLNNLPFVGGGGYEPNFEVRFKGGQEGLDEIVSRAVSYEEGEYQLGTANLNSLPLSKVQVTLKPSTSQTGYGNTVHPSYTLEAAIRGDGSKKSLPVSTGFLEKAGFSVTAARKDEFLHIRSEKSFPNHTIVTYSGMSQNAQLTYNLTVAGLTHEEVSGAVTGFAEALEAVVNGIYQAARKAPPELTLELKLGEQVKRIRGRKVEVASGQSAYAASGSRGELDDETSAPNLEAVRSEVTFKDIGGYQSVKEQFNDFIFAIKNPKEVGRHGYTPPKGILLYGPPGTGKTLFGKAIAGEAGANFFYVDPTELLDKYVGESPRMLRQLFENAGKTAVESKKPVIVFMDEIDTILLKRSSQGGSDAVTSQLVNVFNQYMDGFKTGKIPNVYVVAATNRFDELDKAAVRPPRFVHVEMPLPDLEARVAIFQVTKDAIEREAGTPLFDPAINYTPLAERADKFSGADVAAVMRATRQAAFRQAATTEQKAVVMTTAADLEAQINDYNRQKQQGEGSGKGPIGFGRHTGG